MCSCLWVEPFINTLYMVVLQQLSGTPTQWPYEPDLLLLFCLNPHSSVLREWNPPRRFFEIQSSTLRSCMTKWSGIISPGSSPLKDIGFLQTVSHNGYVCWNSPKRSSAQSRHWGTIGNARSLLREGYVKFVGVHPHIGSEWYFESRFLICMNSERITWFSPLIQTCTVFIPDEYRTAPVRIT